MKFKIQALSSIRMISNVNEKNNHQESLPLFDRLISFVQRDMTVETSLEYELPPFVSLCSTTKIRKLTRWHGRFCQDQPDRDDRSFWITYQSCCILAGDGWWLFYMQWNKVRLGRRLTIVTWATCSVSAVAHRRAMWSSTLKSMTIFRTALAAATYDSSIPVLFNVMT